MLPPSAIINKQWHTYFEINFRIWLGKKREEGDLTQPWAKLEVIRAYNRIVIVWGLFYCAIKITSVENQYILAK